MHRRGKRKEKTEQKTKSEEAYYRLDFSAIKLRKRIKNFIPIVAIEKNVCISLFHRLYSSVLQAS